MKHEEILEAPDRLARGLRPSFEQVRRRARHGTHKVLGVLSIALYLLSDARRGRENA